MITQLQERTDKDTIIRNITFNLFENTEKSRLLITFDDKTTSFKDTIKNYTESLLNNKNTTSYVKNLTDGLDTDTDKIEPLIKLINN